MIASCRFSISKMLLVLVVSAVFLIVSQEIPRTAHAKAIIERDYFAFNVENCGVETVAISGIVQFIGQSNGTHFHSHIKAKGTGVGLDTGAVYEWNDSFRHYIENATPGGAKVVSLTGSTMLISHGPLPNVVFLVNAQITLAPDGTVVVDRFESSGDCNP